MEFVEGQPLSQLVPTDGLPAETVVRYGEQIAAALAHAHERGVIHRDLKTANVVSNPEGGAKVLDFGLARRTASRSASDATQSHELAEPESMVGTLAYVAPEILLGQTADARTDIWALGVVLYEMATGQLPFQGRNAYELTAAILRSPAQPFPAHVPPILRAIILRCLAKEPAHRYQRAGEAGAALEAIHSDLDRRAVRRAGAENTCAEVDRGGRRVGHRRRGARRMAAHAKPRRRPGRRAVARAADARTCRHRIAPSTRPSRRTDECCPMSQKARTGRSISTRGASRAGRGSA